MKATILFLLLLTGIQISPAQVTIFENTKFGGRSRALGVGTYRFFNNSNGDFNDIISSIKVPKGLSAVLFENADEGGGFGFSIDLLEDVDDLTKYNFSDKTSYISVFNTDRQGYIWVRGMRVNNQYVPAHWERARANGSNPNTPTATVSPFIMSNIIKQQFTGVKMIVNKVSGLLLDVKGGSNTTGTQIWQYSGNSTVSQRFTFAEDGTGFFNIMTKDQLYVSMKFNAQVSNGSASSGSSRILVQDSKYGFSPACNFSVTSNCSPHQSWEFIPVPNEPFTYLIRNIGLNQVLQSSSNESGTALVSAPNTNSENQKWVFLSDQLDMFVAPKANPAELTEYSDIVQNQLGVAVLGGETAKPFYFHNNQSGEQVYKYKKIILGGKDLDAWFPVVEYKKTLCGQLKAYHLCDQDFWHDSFVNSDKDVNMHIIPDPKFANLLSNPHMNNYTSPTGQYFQDRLSAHCSVYTNQPFNCTNNTTIKNQAVQKATADVQKLIQDHKWTDIEVEFTPSRFPNNSFINPIFSFSDGSSFKTIEAAHEKACAFGPWMWERILYSDWPIIGSFKDSHFNNEIHPANQIWFRKPNYLQLIALVDETGYFEKKSATENEASGLNQAMRFYIAFEIPSAILGKKLVEYSTSGLITDLAHNATHNRGPIANEAVIFKYKNSPQLKLTVIYNADFKTHRVFLDKVRKRSDGSIQGYFVVETVPITQKGGSISVVVINQTK